MRYRRFGRTELQMPLITCGGMRFQQSWDDLPWSAVTEVSQNNIGEIVARAHALGIRHLETARGYGSSEMQLGRVLKSFPREDWILQTKVAPHPSPKVFLKNFEISLGHLQVDCVDLLGLHGINNASVLRYAMRKGGCLAAARQLQKEGRVKHVGFSSHGGTRVILDAIESGEFDYVNLHWYFVNELNWPAVQAAARRDMGVFIISPNDKGGKLYAPPEPLVSACAPLHPMVFNDLFCWSRPDVHTLSMGVSRPEDFDVHVQALDLLDRAPELVPPSESRLRERIQAATGIAWEPGWDLGFPEWEKVPRRINSREIVRLWMFAKSLEMVEFGRMRYNLLGNAGHWFPGRKVRRFNQRRMIEVHRDSPFADRLPAILRDAHALLDDKAVQRLSRSD